LFLRVFILTEVYGVNKFFSNFRVFECIFNSLTYLNINDINIDLVFSLGTLNKVSDKLSEMLEDW